MSFVFVGSKQKLSKIVSEEDAKSKIITQEAKQTKSVDSIIEDKYKLDNADLNKKNLQEQQNQPSFITNPTSSLNNTPNNVSINNIDFPLIFFIFIGSVLICLGGYIIWERYSNSDSDSDSDSDYKVSL